MQNPFCAVLLMHNNDLLKSLRGNVYQYAAGLKTVASLASRMVDAVSVDIILERSGKEHFLKDNFSLAAVDDHHCRS